MPTKDELLKERIAKAQAQKAKYARQEQALTAKLAKQTRAEDTHRKILDGVTAAYGCAASEEYRRLHEQFRARALTLPKDRAVFNLPPLPPELIVNRTSQEQDAVAAARVVETDDVAIPLEFGEQAT